MSNEDRLTLEAGHVGTGSFLIRIPPHYSTEVRAILDEQGIETGEVLELSHGPGDLVFMIVGAAGSVAGVASAVHTFLSRHPDTSFRLRFGDREFEARNCTPEEAKEWVGDALKQLEARDEQWRKLKGED